MDVTSPLIEEVTMLLLLTITQVTPSQYTSYPGHAEPVNKIELGNITEKIKLNRFLLNLTMLKV